MAETAETKLSLTAGSQNRATIVGTQLKLIALLIAICAGLVGAVEIISGRPFDQIYSFMTSRPGMTTVVIVFAGALGLDVVMGRAFRSLIILAPFVIILAFLSRQKQLYLSDPLYPSDLLFARQIKELLPVMVSAQPVLALGFALAAAGIAGLVVFSVFFAWNRFPRLCVKARLLRLVFALPLLVGFAPMMKYTDHFWFRDRLAIIPMMWDQAANYRHNGFLIAFALNLPMSHVGQPDGYSAEAVAAIPQSSSAPVPGLSSAIRTQDPDVIVIMSESLWDPTKLENIRFSSDPMPVIRQNQTGSIFSPEFGGMTANVEFEALTGFSNAFLPYGSIPYQQYIRGPVPSLATFFGQHGYNSVAIHPFEGWFWNRTSVYEDLGFETFLSQEYLPPLDKRGKFAADDDLMDEIMKVGDKSERPLFLFAVTLQGHGPYEANRYAHNEVSFEGRLSSGAEQALLTYSQGVKEADASLAKLMAWAKGRSRETIIVMFGDHLPPMGRVFRETGYMDNAVATRRAPMNVMAREHETPLIVWSSKTGSADKLGAISPALLGYHILQSAGFSHPFYTGFLGQVAQQYSVIDRYMLLDANGDANPGWKDANKDIPTILKAYRLVQYDMMFGEHFATERFFPTPLKGPSQPEMPVAGIPQPEPFPG